MRSTQWYRGLALLLIAGVLLAACAKPTATPVPTPVPPTKAPAAVSTQAPTKAPTPEPTKPPQPVKIRATIWITAAEQEALGKLLEAYQKTHPNVQVEWINITGGGPYGRDKLQTMIAGGDAPDLMMLNTGQFEAFAARDVLLPLDSFVDQDKFDLSAYWPQAIAGSKYQGKLYALPRDMSNVILFYNKDLFDKAGVAYPTADWTWNDMLKAAKTLTRDTNGDGKIDQWGFAVNNVVWAWAGFVSGNGGQALSADRKQCLFQDAKTVEALQFYFDLLTKEKVSPPPGALPQQATAQDQMKAQSIAMGLFGPWFRPGLATMEKPFRWDVAAPPKSPSTGKRGTVVYTDHWAIYSKSKVAKEAWDLIRFLTGKEAQEMWVKLRGARSISPVKAVAQTPDWIGYGGSSGQIILDSLAFGEAPPVNFGNANEVETIWNQEFGLVIAGQQTVAQAVANICKKAGPVLAQSQ